MTDDGPPDPTDEEVEAKRKALRYRVVEAFEGLGWDVRLRSGDIILGAGRAHLQALAYDRVLIYAPVEDPSFSPEDVNDINADIDLAAFFAAYRTEGGGTAWGGFLRVSLPDGDLGTDELGRWLEAQVVDVLGATRAFDKATGDDSA
ncbi:hypothetical protein [Miltoncostaea oceani]|uniref:hypothetical protein n=1 Tax=Miltoncostaea oceani TaxID=2843216 RepID=UPI001C3E1FB2|nr:hypothetical protein [Miltoncostaea oceani]